MPQDHYLPAADQETREQRVITPAQNLVFLMETFEKLGFGETFNKDLNQSIASGKDEFDLPAKRFHFKDTDEYVHYSPNIAKREGTDIYDFKGYTASLEKDPDKRFFVNVRMKSGFTANQARNLLNGRTVGNWVRGRKTNQSYHRQTRLNFNEKTEWGNVAQIHMYDRQIPEYNVMAILNKMPNIMRDYSQQEKEAFVRRLEDGDRISVPIQNRATGQRITVTLEALPHEQAISLTNSQGQSHKYSVNAGPKMAYVPLAEPGLNQAGNTPANGNPGASPSPAATSAPEPSSNQQTQGVGPAQPSSQTPGHNQGENNANGTKLTKAQRTALARAASVADAIKKKSGQGNNQGKRQGQG